jgi:lysophospholipase L1-like esterase
MLACSFAAFSACSDSKTNEIDNSGTKLLVLGDSIAEAILGPTPITERENYSYCGIVGQINGYTYNNRSISGHTTAQCLEYVSQTEDTTAYVPITLIKEADVIEISILGNDLLQNNFNTKLIAALNGDFTKVDEILGKSYDNIDGIVKRIKELNPDVTLIIQTVYNPVYPGSTIIDEKTIDTIINDYGKTRSDLYNVGGLLINRMNDVLFTYIRNNPGAFIILDVNAKFDALYRADSSRLDRLIYNDCVHPSSEGHAVIACLLQEKLEDLGLADHDYAMANYKSLRCSQLERLYSDTSVNVKTVKKAINAATTYNSVNDVYFDAVDGVTPNY